MNQGTKIEKFGENRTANSEAKLSFSILYGLLQFEKVIDS